MEADGDCHKRAALARVCLILPVCCTFILSSASFAFGTQAQDSAPLAEDSPLGAQTNNWPSSGEDSWNFWWSYSGVSGPAYWGLLNSDWFLCSQGRRQSPIDIDLRSLIYDPHLTPLRADRNLISGVLHNDGHAIVFNCSLRARKLLAPKQKQLQPPPPVADNELDDGQPNGNRSEIKRRRRESAQNSQFSAGGRRDESDSEALLQVADVGEPLRQEPDASGEDDTSNEIQPDDDADELKIQLAGAGLAYPFRFEALYLRFGARADNREGSEHRLGSRSAAAELQLIAYNSHLYKSYEEASTRPHGLLAIGVFVQVSSRETSSNAPNKELDRLLGVHNLNLVGHRGAATLVRAVNLTALLPETDQFVAYEGSLTQPSCHETVHWLILNRPIYITQANLDKLRSISAEEQSRTPAGTLLAGNIRPIQPTNNRPVRTNIRPIVARKSPNGATQAPETCSRLWLKYEYKQAKA